MPVKEEWWKLITGKKPSDLLLRPKLTETYLKKRIASKDQPVLLGRGDEDVYFTEGERESHVHIIGAPGSGKSKLIEYLVRHDIDRLKEEWSRGIHPKDGRACGLCLLDPSEDGDTVNKVLAYCSEIGFDRILLIDPLRYDSHQKLPTISLFNAPPTHWAASINYLVDAFRVVYEVEDLSRTSYIKTYLTSLFGIFHFANLTGSDLIYFTEPPDNSKDPVVELAVYESKRQQIFALVRKRIESGDFPGKWRMIAHKYLASLEIAYKNLPNFTREVGSTARRLNTLVTSPVLQHIFGHRKGVSFDRLISEGWVILVNVSTGGGLGDLEARLLGTIVINQLVHGIKRIRRHGFNKPFYLYIDEAGQYVTYTLADILAHKRKIGLRTTLAHQYREQLDNELVRNAIIKCTGIKCMFPLEDSDEREWAVKMLGYGGELSTKDVAYNLSSLKKQEMVIRLPKQSPVKVKVPDVPDSEGSVKKIINTLFQDKHYRTLKDIKDDERKRFEGAHPPQPGRGAKPDNRPPASSAGRKTQHPPKSVAKSGTGQAAGKETVRSVDELFLEAEKLKKSD